MGVRKTDGQSEGLWPGGRPQVSASAIILLKHLESDATARFSFPFMSRRERIGAVEVRLPFAETLPACRLVP